MELCSREGWVVKGAWLSDWLSSTRLDEPRLRYGERIRWHIVLGCRTRLVRSVPPIQKRLAAVRLSH